MREVHSPDATAVQRQSDGKPKGVVKSEHCHDQLSPFLRAFDLFFVPADICYATWDEFTWARLSPGPISATRTVTVPMVLGGSSCPADPWGARV